jgi:hypothetical protein
MFEQIEEHAACRDYQLVAITRGGLTLGHRLAVLASKPLSFYNPKTHTLHQMGSSITDSGHQAIFFIEDLIAKGRTYENVRAYMLIYYPRLEENKDWFYCPLVVDKKFADDRGSLDLKIYGSIESDWVVFPYEDEVDVVEGDHGLFRDGTGQYGKGRQ